MSFARTPEGIAWEAHGAGPAVLLMHEGIGNRGTWDDLVGELAEDFTAITFDARGFGDSEDPPEGYSMHDDALAVLEAAGVDEAALIGTSMHGEIALDLALEEPEIVTALVLESATPSGWGPDEDLRAGFERAGAAYEAGDADGANEIEMELWMDGVGRTEPVDPAVRARVAAINRDLLDRLEGLPEPVELEPPAMGQLGELTVPTLIVTGSHDQPTVLKAAGTMVRETGAERVDIPGAAHLPHLEKPADFLAAVLPFLRANASKTFVEGSDPG